MTLTALWRFVRRSARVVLVLPIAFLAISGIVYFGFERLLHAAHETLRSHPSPLPDYPAALDRFRRLQETEGPEATRFAVQFR
jgi:hypothetical protein